MGVEIPGGQLSIDYLGFSELKNVNGNDSVFVTALNGKIFSIASWLSPQWQVQRGETWNKSLFIGLWNQEKKPIGFTSFWFRENSNVVSVKYPFFRQSF